MCAHRPITSKRLRILAWPYLTIQKKNPFQRLLYQGIEQQGAQVDQYSARRLVTGNWTIWHIHWPESLIASVPPKPLASAIIQILKSWILLKVARLKRVRIVWTVHNFKPHESTYPKLESFWLKLFVRNLDAAICLSESGKHQLVHRYPRSKHLPVYVIPHGHYRGWYPDTISAADARAQLSVAPGDHLALFFGLIRPYKNVPNLIQCFLQTSVEDWNLIVAGQLKHEAMFENLNNARSGSKRVALLLDFVKDKEVQIYFRAAELFVVPYTDVLNSGSAILSLSFDCPVLVPNKGAMGDLQRLVGPDWVMTYDGDLSPQLLREAFAWARDVHRSECAPLDDLDWLRISNLTLSAFRNIASSGSGSLDSGSSLLS